jgi:hypothetical protein
LVRRGESSVDEAREPGWASAVPRWEEMSPARRVFEALVLPVGWGILCGLALGVSEPLYLVGVVIGILGGVGGGMQHATSRDALIRGLWAGTLFGLSILLGFEIGGADEATVELPDPSVLLLAFTVIPALPLHWLGWRLRSRTA